jgi:hypothetical protein
MAPEYSLLKQNFYMTSPTLAREKHDETVSLFEKQVIRIRRLFFMYE